jgi:seryl-tRNA synthetase
MLTPKYVRDNLDAIRQSLGRRKSAYPIDELVGLEEQTRKIGTELQELRAERNRGTMRISEAKKLGKPLDAALVYDLAELKKKMDSLEATLPKSLERLDFLMWNLPNVLHESVPYGKDDTENAEIRKWGEPSRRKIPGHAEILERLGLLDTDQASKVAGARFFYLKGDLALLEQSLIRFAIDELNRKGFTLIAPPLMMKREFYRGVTALGDFEEALYKAADPSEAEGKKELEHVDETLFMVSTSEHPVAAMCANRVFGAKELPAKYMGWSPCFRREAGAHGKDTKGIFRVHQFYKVEQFVFSRPEDSWTIVEELLNNAEELFQKLKIPYRVVNICTGDIGVVAAKKYDLEAYLPGQDAYREMVSCSNCTDWQALRLDIKYDEKGERNYVHTLNSTAIATNRTMVAIIENYYNDDGTITVPDVLIPYMGKSKIG